MNSIATIDSRIPAVLQQQDLGALGSDLVGGAEGGFAVLSIRGSRFRVKEGGEERVVTNTEGDARSSLEVILIKSHPKLSKLYYAKDYEEGADDPPDCFSTDGEAPADDSPSPQAKSCAVCPHNKWGSKLTPAGKKTKACSDNRRVVLLPAADVTAEPMLLRVPAASLAALADYGKKLLAKGIPYNALVTRLSFDESTAYPKLSFKPESICTDEQAAAVVEHLHGAIVERILNTSEIPAGTSNVPDAKEEDDFDRVAKQAAEKAAAAAAPAEPAPSVAATPEPAPEPAPEPPAAASSDVTNEPVSGGDDLDALLDNI